MRKDSRHQYSLQLPSAEELEKSPTWQQIRTAYQHIEKIRERLPQYTSEQLEKIRVVLKTPAENSALDRLIAEARERREQEIAKEQEKLRQEERARQRAERARKRKRAQARRRKEEARKAEEARQEVTRQGAQTAMLPRHRPAFRYEHEDEAFAALDRSQAENPRLKPGNYKKRAGILLRVLRKYGDKTENGEVIGDKQIPTLIRRIKDHYNEGRQRSPSRPRLLS